MKKLITNTGVKVQITMENMMNKIKNKLIEEDGISLSKENLIWIIIILIVRSLAIVFFSKLFPELFEMIGNKVKSFFNKIVI